MEPSDRRIGIRIDLELFLNQYVRDRPYRVLAANLSETGIFVHRVSVADGGAPRGAAAASSWASHAPQASATPPGTPVGLEIELPGTGEVIWARGEVCRESWGSRRTRVRGGRSWDSSFGAGRSVRGTALRFADMPRAHARLVRDFCHQRRIERLDAILDRIRRMPPSAPLAAPARRAWAAS
ncbi:MAG TPA: hypothetical protein VKZ63_08085 [Kofleriaceae bacterium]|nr:hypothetical protein [Kofleriaceae bacterium]